MKDLGVLILSREDWLSSLESGSGEAGGCCGDGFSKNELGGGIGSGDGGGGGCGDGSGFCESDGGRGCGRGSRTYYETFRYQRLYF